MFEEALMVCFQHKANRMFCMSDTTGIIGLKHCTSAILQNLFNLDTVGTLSKTWVNSLRNAKTYDKLYVKFKPSFPLCLYNHRSTILWGPLAAMPKTRWHRIVLIGSPSEFTELVCNFFPRVTKMIIWGYMQKNKWLLCFCLIPMSPSTKPFLH